MTNGGKYCRMLTGGHSGLENLFLVYLRVAVLDRFYCNDVHNNVTYIGQNLSQFSNNFDVI